VQSKRKKESIQNEIETKSSYAKAIEVNLLQKKELSEMKSNLAETFNEMEAAMEESRKKLKQS
jgi:hypothetical protein